MRTNGEVVMQQALTLEAAVALANQLLRARKWDALEQVLRAIVGAIEVRDRLEPASLGYQLRAQLIEALYWQNKYAAAVDAFAELLGVAGITCSDAFDRRYLEGLRRTSTCPLPVRRMHRHHHLTELFERTAALGGEIAECGCYRGLSSYLLCATVRAGAPDFDGFGHHIFDSFAGLGAPEAEDRVAPDGEDARIAAMCQEGAFEAALEDVQRHLGDFPRIAYHPGWIPQSFAGIAERSYRFVHVDVDLYAPTAAAFEYFYPRLVPGGMIVCDDYNWPGARKAVDAFAARYGLEVHPTAFQQAWVRREP